MILSDRSLRSQIESGRIKIDPYDPDLLQPCSIDMRLGDTVRWELSLGVIDPADPPQKATIVSTGLTILKPGQFLLGATKEYVQIPDDLAGRHRVAVAPQRHHCVGRDGAHRRVGPQRNSASWRPSRSHGPHSVQRTATLPRSVPRPARALNSRAPLPGHPRRAAGFVAARQYEPAAFVGSICRQAHLWVAASGAIRLQIETEPPSHDTVEVPGSSPVVPTPNVHCEPQ